MVAQGVDIISLKAVSSLFNNPVFNNIVDDIDHDIIDRRVSKYLKANKGLKLNTYHEFFSHVYDSMLKNYRNEFIYKNEIVNKILLGKHSLNTTTMLNEFKIGKSIADLVMLNGTSIVYEIKTELDSTERLLSQIENYRKTFLNVIIVTHYSTKDKYLNFLEKHNLHKIGLMVFTKQRTISLIRKPQVDSSYLDITFMFKCLRREEYTNAIKDYFGYIPDVPNTRIFKKCLELAHEIKPEKFHERMFFYLKKRGVKEKKIISSHEIPVFMKHISVCSNFRKRDFIKLNIFLNKSL
ncbi:sce7726 family protein [Aquimarina algiphila]|uniref:Sce7726 family protein n=1 Tax=Aquimarina algiphila TaxID=2047982 RepID=A0A554VAG3_9FLAO|nr:sce7726 family protein [Aquimarina algiphila]TSE03046.1 sce7726 family protein [Aquimarina algiphila]